MINKRKFLYRRSVVDGRTELDYLRTELVRADLGVEKEITITDPLAYRPDLISKVAYGDYNYGWLIMDFNDILDPYEQLSTGRVIQIPKLSDYFEFYNDASRIERRVSEQTE